ncbi:phage holin family protein [Nocardioides campestrisoli]|uniref:phage holin family protein n=1 Tax=Nocardioides campestrisoli TaxID=2736757 RepID=UPI0015E654C7|nr:phage holin family protein [Nocardioides campestrisoli]
MRFLSWLIATALAVAAAAWLFDGISFSGASEPFSAELQDKIGPLLAVSLIFGVVNILLGNLLKLLSLPFIVLTLGLFLVVINALLLMFTAWIADSMDLGFHVDGFWTAVGGSIVISVVGWFFETVLSD